MVEQRRVTFLFLQGLVAMENGAKVRRRMEGEEEEGVERRRKRERESERE